MEATNRTMEEKEKSNDEDYFDLLKNNGYEIFKPKTDSEEEDILKGLKYIIDYFLGPKVLDIKLNIKIYLINDAMINAAVCKCGNTYYISLFRGVINDIKDFVLNFIIKNFPHKFFKSCFKKTYRSTKNVFEFFKEEDCEDYYLANNIANNILFLIVYHEIGHIFCGHQEKSNSNNKLFMEANRCKDGNICGQAKELMADFFGLINSLSIYTATYNKSFEEYSFYQCCYLISLYSLYIYFEKNEKEEYNTYEKLLERSHPHPAVRLLYMMDFLGEETEYELKELYKVEWLTDDNLGFCGEEDKCMLERLYQLKGSADDNTKGTLMLIDGLSYCAICEFSLNLPGEFRLVNESYENEMLKIRQEIQNTASDLYEKEYKEIAIVKLSNIGKVKNSYIENLLKSNEVFGKYDAIEIKDKYHFKI